MATKGNTMPERIARWKVLNVSLSPQLPEVPHLTSFHGELHGAIQESEVLDARHEALKAESREVNRRREELGKIGDDLRNRIGASLQTLYGFKSEKLIEFGLKPRRTRGRARKPEVRPTQPARDLQTIT